ncbi:hypothetical protein Tco_0180420 [Tanacetum coccineum]
MKLLFFTFHIQTQTTLKLSQTSSPNVVLGRHLLKHQISTRSIYLSSGMGRQLKPKETLKKSLLPPRWRVNIDYARLIWEDLISKLDKKTREKVVPYPRFLSLLLEHEMEGYGNDDHMLAICNVEKPVAIKAPKTSLKDKKKSSLALDTNLSQPPTSTHVVAGMHNENQQATGGPTSLGVTSKEGVNPQLIRVMSASITKHVYSYSIILHSKFSSRHDASAAFTTEADLGKSDPNDSVSHQQEKSKSASEGLETEDLSKLMENVDVDFMDLDSPKDDQLIIVQEDEDEEVNAKKDGAKKVHAEEPKETKDASGQVSSIQAKIKTLDALLSLLSKVTKALHRFAKAVEKASPAKSGESSPPQPEGELIKKDKGKKAVSSKDAGKEGTESESNEEDKLTGSMVRSSKPNKLKQFDFKLKKGTYYTEGLSKQKKARWSTIYEKIKKRMDYLHKTKAELEIDFSKPFSEQDPLDKLNDLAIKKRKHVDDIHDYFRSTKKFKSLVQYEDHPARTVLNNPCLSWVLSCSTLY